MQIPGKLVVRTYAPARRWVVLSIVALLACLALYVMFELGRYKAGYDALQAAAQREACSSRSTSSNAPNANSTCSWRQRSSRAWLKARSAPRWRAPSANCRRRWRTISRK